MTKLENSQFGRQSCQHKIIPLEGPEGSGLGACFDDVYEMNPRKSSLTFSVLYLCNYISKIPSFDVCNALPVLM